MEIQKIQDVVFTCLQNDVNARSNDKVLYIDVCEKLGLSTAISLKDWSINKYPSTESVRRSRQKIQADGYFLPAAEVVEARSQLEEEMYKWSKLKQQSFEF